MPDPNGRRENPTGPFLDRAGRPRSLLRLVFQYLTFWLVTSSVATLVLGGWLAVRAGGEPADLDPATLAGSPALPLVSSVAGLLGSILSVWLAARFLDQRRVRDLGLRPDRAWWGDLGFGLLLGAALISALFVTELALGWISVEGTLGTNDTQAPFALALLFPLVTFLCVGFYEELVHRGYQIQNASEGLSGLLGPRAAVLAAWTASSAFFGLLHAQNPNATPLSTINICLAGVMLGAGYVLTGSLAIPIGLHITWNFFQGAVYGLPVSGLGPFGATFLVTEQTGPDLWTGGSFGPEAGLLSPAAMLLGTLLIFLRTRLKTGKASLHATIAGVPKNPHPKDDSSRPAEA